MPNDMSHNQESNTESNNTEREYDIILYGASAFTAKYVIEELEKTKYKVALAGRDSSKFHHSIYDVLECSVDEIETITKRTRVLMCIAGPYTNIGEKIIRACVESETDYVDITGEVGFIIKMQQKYNSQARATGVAIVNSCGFDSIPSDMGAFYLAKHFEKCEIIGELYDGTKCINTGTWNSFLESMKSYNDSKGGKKTQDQTKEGETTKLKKSQPIYYKVEDADYYRLKFLGPDNYVVKKSSEHLENLFKYKYTMYFTVYSRIKLYLALLWMLVISKMAATSLGNKILRKFPRFFSCGVFKKGGPSDAAIRKGRFVLLMTAKGTTAKKEERTMKVGICGPDAAYVSCAIFVTQCAYQLLKHRDKIASGVLTPVSAFHKTNIISCLMNKGIMFTTHDEAKNHGSE